MHGFLRLGPISKVPKREVATPLAGPGPSEPPGKMHTFGIPVCFTAHPLSLFREVLNLSGFVLAVAEV